MRALVVNVLQSWPQAQYHLSSLRGDWPQSGQRVRGSDGTLLFSSSRSTTTDELETSFKRGESLLGEKPILNLGKLHGTRTFLVVIRHVIDPSAHGIAPHHPGIARPYPF